MAYGGKPIRRVIANRTTVAVEVAPNIQRNAVLFKRLQLMLAVVCGVDEVTTNSSDHPTTHIQLHGPCNPHAAASAPSRINLAGVDTNWLNQSLSALPPDPVRCVRLSQRLDMVVNVATKNLVLRKFHALYLAEALKDEGVLGAQVSPIALYGQKVIELFVPDELCEGELKALDSFIREALSFNLAR